MTEDLDRDRPVARRAVPADRPVARRAVPADAAELTRLRSVMFEEMGTVADDGWHAACEADLAELLAGDGFAAFVVDAPDGSGLGCSAIGSLGRRLPAPHRPHRRRSVGHVSSVATDPRWRRRGMARAALEALLDWFADRGVTSVTLNATPQAEALYRSLGFADPEHRALRLTVPDRPAPGGEPGRTADPPGGSGLPDLGDQLTAGDAHP